MLRQLFLLLQLVVSARPGLVDIVDGDVNVRLYEHIPPGKIIQTGANSHVEFSLGWEAYLRLEEKSRAANFMAHYADARPNFFLFQAQVPNDAAWMFSPSLNGFTFVPRYRHNSYYKHTFVPLMALLPPPVLLPSMPIVVPELPNGASVRRCPVNRRSVGRLVHRRKRPRHRLQPLRQPRRLPPSRSKPTSLAFQF